MLQSLDVLQLASRSSEHAARRHAVIARNIANADTPGFKARDLEDFSEVLRASEPTVLARTRPGHLPESDAESQFGSRPLGNLRVDANGNSVSVEAEMVRMAANRQQHDLATAVYKSSIGILRASLGR